MGTITSGGSELPPLTEDLVDSLRISLFNNSRDTAGGHTIWTGTKTEKGYGKQTVSYKGKRFVIRAHRVAWAVHTGKWPNRFIDIHHKCGNPSCINPDHLEAVRAVEHSGQVRKTPRYRNQYTSRGY